MHSYQKRQPVVFSRWGRSETIHARVETVHRDGTLTVRALHPVNGADTSRPFKYRLGPETLRVSSE